ncbi:MAG: nitroreductase family protein [Solobacterium sp.]|nr:nitroreductase family protein [Solobacterium sp.]
MNQSFYDIVRNRRSTRSFTTEHILDETINNILDIASYAPSSWGGHPIEFIIIRDKDKLKELARCKKMGAGPLAYSDVAIVPIIDKRNLELWVEDAAVASTYILLAAEYYGVGACWIHMKDRQGHTNMAEDDIKDLLGIPDYYGILNAVSLGYPAKPNKPHDLKPVIHGYSSHPDR